jgi:hypothetical protein
VISSLRQKLEDNTAELTELRSRVEVQARDLCTRSEIALAEERRRARQLEQRVAELEQELGQRSDKDPRSAIQGFAADRAQEVPSRSQQPEEASGSGTAHTAEMLAMMEGQLGRLSEIIRQRDAEVRSNTSPDQR